MHEKISVIGAPVEAVCCASDLAALAKKIKNWGRELGFAEIGIASADVSGATRDFMLWLHLGRHGEMHYMAKHAALRAQPKALVPGTLSVISARLPYWPDARDAQSVLDDAQSAYISRYALGRDYHKTVRQRLQKLAGRIEREIETGTPGTPFAYRVFSDSAPVLEVEFARQAGISWRGKHSLSLSRRGSWHFLGEIYCTLPLPPDATINEHCGRCTRCIDACPTAAIVAPYQIDARLCISYLTIELADAIPVELRPLIGNRIYGCDDCQLCCPWNRYAQIGDPDFAVRSGLDSARLVDLFGWSKEQFDNRLAGSPIRRIGHERWLRNIAVALGNCAATTSASTDLATLRSTLATRLEHPSPLVREHVAWALEQARRA